MAKRPEYMDNERVGPQEIRSYVYRLEALLMEYLELPTVASNSETLRKDSELRAKIKEALDNG